ncbi:TDT family transporter [Methanobrevibacter sp.]|uniref:TDT family transporter n=1 Tax=Methanobrevibacter sp. TaxID=66852 RepID=UPI00388CF4CE
MSLIKNIPLPVSGLILALLSLGNLTQDIHPHFRYLFGTLGAIFIILIVLKIILHSQKVKEDLKNPVILSSFGTFSMSIMLLSTYLIGFHASFAYGVWILGIAMHILLMIYFTYHFIIHNFNISNIYPSIWIVYVGITMAAITSGIHGQTEMGFIFFIIGFISMIITLPVIIYRYLKYPGIPDMNKPLICIFTAIFSILIVGYINTSQNMSNEFLMALYCLACAFYLFAFVKLIQYIRLDFYPSFSAFTFPFVISALATKGILAQLGFNNLVNGILKIEMAIAILIVAYVLLKYIMFLKNNMKSRN